MGKSIQESIFKSRLTISYRVNIDGTLQQESLPYRLLVLGEFSGRAMRTDGLLPDLADREIKSIKRGTTVNDHLSEIHPIWKIPAGPGLKELQSLIPGKVTFDRVTCNVANSAIKNNEGATFLLSGTATFSSSMASNGLCNLEGKVRIGGTVSVAISNGVVTATAASVSMAGLVCGHYADPGTGKTAGVMTALVSTKLELKEGIAMAPDEDTEVAPGALVKPFLLKLEPIDVAADRTVPFPSIEAFSPDAITAAIPELRRLQAIKRLLTDLQSNMRNRPELRKLVKALLPAYGSSDDDVQKKLVPFTDLKAWAETVYPLLKIDRPANGATNGDQTTPGTPATPPAPAS